MSEELETKNKKINWSPDRIMSTSALFVSLISVVALFYQLSLAREENELIRQQQSASVFPHLTLSFSTAPEHYKMTLINKGIGPAFIKQVEFNINDTIKFQRSDLFINEISSIVNESEGIVVNPGTYSLQEGEVLPANDEIDLFAARGKSERNLFLKYLNSLVQWNYTIIYEDVYGARWRIDSENDFPTLISEK